MPRSALQCVCDSLFASNSARQDALCGFVEQGPSRRSLSITPEAMAPEEDQSTEYTVRSWYPERVVNGAHRRLPSLLLHAHTCTADQGISPAARVSAPTLPEGEDAGVTPHNVCQKSNVLQSGGAACWGIPLQRSGLCYSAVPGACRPVVVPHVGRAVSQTYLECVVVTA